MNHPNWLTFARESNSVNDSPRVIIYINIRLSSLHFSLCKDIISYRDILLICFFNNNDNFWLMNVYSNSSHSALKYLKDTEANIQNLLIMTGNFNIHNSSQDPSFPYHSSTSDNLIIIVDYFNSGLSSPTNQIPTRYSDTSSQSNFIIDLMFLQSGSTELNNHPIHPDQCLMLDHAPLTVTIPIVEKNINSTRFSIVKNSEEETSFIKDVSSLIRNIDVSNLSNIDRLKNVINLLVLNIEHIWKKNSKLINVLRHSKSWWNYECNQCLRNYRTLRSLEDWKIFGKKVKTTIQSFFDLKIQEILNKK